MKVREAQIFGLIAGFIIAYSPELSDFAEQIKIFNLTLSLIFIVFGHRVTGTTGGLFYGLGVGIALGVIFGSITSL